MASKPEKLLEQMRRSKTGWTRRDLDTLYNGYGFVVSHGSKHDIVKHPKYPSLRTTLPRTREIAKGYVQEAVSVIDRLLQLEEATRE